MSLAVVVLVNDTEELLAVGVVNPDDGDQLYVYPLVLEEPIVPLPPEQKLVSIPATAVGTGLTIT